MVNVHALVATGVNADGTPTGNPRFVSDGANAITGTWSSVGSFSPDPLTGRGTTVLTATGLPFSPGALAGRLLNPKTSQKRQAYILNNTANALIVAGDMAGGYGVVAGDSFKVIDYQLSSGSAATDAGNLADSTSWDITGLGRGIAPDIGAYELAPGGDVIPPTATLLVSNLTNPSATRLLVTYSDSVAVDVSTLSSADLRVTSANGFNQLATFIGVDMASNGSVRTATYQIPAPGEFWTVAANGGYAVAMEPDRVKDTSGHAVSAGTLGAFTVAVALPPGNFECSMDFSRTTGDRDVSLGSRPV